MPSLGILCGVLRTQQIKGNGTKKRFTTGQKLSELFQVLQLVPMSHVTGLGNISSEDTTQFLIASAILQWIY